MTEDRAKEIVRHLEEYFGAEFKGRGRPLSVDEVDMRAIYIRDGYIGNDPPPLRQGATIVFPCRTATPPTDRLYNGHFVFPSKEQARAAFVSMQMWAAVS